ncbi:MAG: hypothetical protein HYR94_16060 [Chloroflexi bacterium]|nr:hypothetical protein [Chloroflexota bacterium]
MFLGVDWLVWGTAILFFGLSFVKLWVIRQLPVYCQTSWSLISVVGITSVCMAYIAIHPEAYVHVRNISIIFLFALPGMYILDILQKLDRVNYWETKGVPSKLVGKPLYLKDVLRRFRRNDEVDAKSPLNHPQAFADNP